jgi:hypothetical protein
MSSEVSTDNIIPSRTRSGRSLIRMSAKVFSEARVIYHEQLSYLNKHSLEQSKYIPDTGKQLTKSHLMSRCSKIVASIQSIVASYVDNDNMDDLIVYTELLTWEQRLTLWNEKMKSKQSLKDLRVECLG